jgi:radical SAM superfamily enzyme YgiQ (UPF0313 family)
VRILLVSVNRASAPYAVAPLGISYIAGAARADGHDVALLDLCFSQDVAADIARAVRRSPPELIGVSIRNVDNLTYPASVSYLDEIRAAVATLRTQSSAPMVLGGPGFSIFPERMLSLLGVEFGVIGEGEETFCLLARHLAGGGEVPDLPNLLRQGGDARRTTRRAAPFAGDGRPARDLLDNPRYLALGGMANLQTKRGCPFRCAYCTYPHIDGGSLRLRSPADVVEELASMVEESGLDEVFFVDDIFTWPPDHALGICEEIERRGLRVGWTCFATPLGMTPDLARAMKHAGCRGVEFGTDTASPRLLQALGKPFPQDQIGAATRACREADLPDAHYLIFGGPGETLDTMAETFAFFDELAPRAVLAFLGIRIYPHTPLHGMAVSDGVVGASDDLLAPRFYISPQVGAEALRAAVGLHAADRPNWVVPGLGVRSDPALLSALRRMGCRGPLWDRL